MKRTLEGCSERHRQEAMTELAAELAEFSYDGLTLLQVDLAAGHVVRGSWAGCILSYKRGAAGSTRRDRHGRARNALTVMWDSGWFTDEEVLAAVGRELARRAPGSPHETAPAASPATTPAPLGSPAPPARSSAGNGTATAPP